MTKRLIASMFLLTLLCGPALADSPTRTTSSTMQIALRIDVGKDSRHYTMKLLDHGCGDVESKTRAISSTKPPATPSTFAEDDIKICAHADGTQVVLEIDWATREADHEIRNKSAALVARGSSIDLDAGSAKLLVALQ